MAREKILIVEDEEITSLDLKFMLENLGYEVAEIVSSGEEAVLEANKIRPDLIIMDIFLSGSMDGVEASKIILKEHHVPVIFLTAITDLRTYNSANATNPYGYLIKPVTQGDLQPVIATAIQRHRLENTR